MSHSGSAEYPLPLTGTTSLLSRSSIQHTPEHQKTINRSSAKSVLSSVSQDSLKQSLKIYSVHTHQRKKRRSPSPKITDKGHLNNNYNLEKVSISIQNIRNSYVILLYIQ